MKKLLAFILVLAIILCIVGYYRHWFSVSTQDTPGNHDITISVDKDKIEADKAKAEQKVKEAGQKAVDKLPSSRP